MPCYFANPLIRTSYYPPCNESCTSSRKSCTPSSVSSVSSSRSCTPCSVNWSNPSCTICPSGRSPCPCKKVVRKERLLNVFSGVGGGSSEASGKRERRSEISQKRGNWGNEKHSGGGIDKKPGRKRVSLSSTKEGESVDTSKIKKDRVGAKRTKDEPVDTNKTKYDKQGRLSEIEEGKLVGTSKTKYDKQGRLSEIEEDKLVDTSKTKYDKQGRLSEIEEGKLVGTSKTKYDKQGRLSETERDYEEKNRDGTSRTKEDKSSEIKKGKPVGEGGTKDDTASPGKRKPSRGSKSDYKETNISDVPKKSMEPRPGDSSILDLPKSHPGVTPQQKYEQGESGTAGKGLKFDGRTYPTCTPRWVCGCHQKGGFISNPYWNFIPRADNIPSHYYGQNKIGHSVDNSSNRNDVCNTCGRLKSSVFQQQQHMGNTTNSSYLGCQYRPGGKSIGNNARPFTEYVDPYPGYGSRGAVPSRYSGASSKKFGQSSENEPAFSRPNTSTSLRIPRRCGTCNQYRPGGNFIGNVASRPSTPYGVPDPGYGGIGSRAAIPSRHGGASSKQFYQSRPSTSSSMRNPQKCGTCNQFRPGGIINGNGSRPSTAHDVPDSGCGNFGSKAPIPSRFSKQFYRGGGYRPEFPRPNTTTSLRNPAKCDICDSLNVTSRLELKSRTAPCWDSGLKSICYNYQMYSEDLKGGKVS
ncbi:hypothetical protein JTB14_020202 [Gonioctena quinquepunctata]|nr:hypothetical protein JTB14_020202 [Gonioctena quinquepunctata]